MPQWGSPIKSSTLWKNSNCNKKTLPYIIHFHYNLRSFSFQIHPLILHFVVFVPIKCWEKNQNYTKKPNRSLQSFKIDSQIVFHCFHADLMFGDSLQPLRNIQLAVLCRTQKHRTKFIVKVTLRTSSWQLLLECYALNTTWNWKRQQINHNAIAFFKHVSIEFFFFRRTLCISDDDCDFNYGCSVMCLQRLSSIGGNSFFILLNEISHTRQIVTQFICAW